MKTKLIRAIAAEERRRKREERREQRAYPEDSPQYLKFYANYTNAQKEPPKEPTVYGASAYDATSITLLAIREALGYDPPPVFRLDLLSQADRFRREVADDIGRVSPEYPGATGTFRFDSIGGAENAVIARQKHGAAIYEHVKGTDNAWSYVPTFPTARGTRACLPGR